MYVRGRGGGSGGRGESLINEEKRKKKKIDAIGDILNVIVVLNFFIVEAIFPRLDFMLRRDVEWEISSDG